MVGAPPSLATRATRDQPRGTLERDPRGDDHGGRAPTAFPYFAAITAIVGSGLDTARQLALLVLFNACFVLPLIAILAALAFGGDGVAATLSRTRDRVQAHWPAVLAGLALLGGVLVVLLGAAGLSAHTDFSNFIRNRLFLHQFS